MFDLFRSRQKATRYLLGAILMIVAVSMVVTLIPGYGSSSGASAANDNVIAEIGSQKLTTQDVMRQMQQITRGGQVPAAMLQTYMPQLVENMIQQRALNYEFEREGLKATDDEVVAVLQAEYAQFFQNGKLMSDQLAQALAQNGETLEDAIDSAKNEVLFLKIQNLEYESTVVTPKEVDAELARKYERAKIRYIAFTPVKFRDQVKVTPDEIKAYYNAHKGNYLTPEKRSFQVLVIDQDKVEKSITITRRAVARGVFGVDGQFPHAGARARAPHHVQDHRQVRRREEADPGQGRGRAEADQRPAPISPRWPRNIPTIQPTLPRAAISTGWSKGQTVPEFERVAFSLKPNEISGIVTTTPYGYHIIQVLAHEPARVKPFDEVKASLTDELKKQESHRQDAIGGRPGARRARKIAGIR